MSDATVVARDQLLSIIERVERVQAEIDALNEDKSEIFKEAKGNGFHTKAIKKIIKDRAADPIEREEEDAILDLYMRALGMVPDSLVRARVENIEEISRNRTSEPLPSKGEDEGFSPPASGGDDEAGNDTPPPAHLPCKDDSPQGKHASDPDSAKSDAATNGSSAEAREGGIGVTGKSEEAVSPANAGGVSSLQTQPEARMPRASSPVNTGKGGKLPVPGPESNRFARERGEFKQRDIPEFLRRDGKKAQPAAECKDISQAV